ncbi:glycosyltransferase [Bacteroides fluxus]|uniref:glycosyltransferase n=1 Tax=Bacteroides fluxus TaxID=626930 RepID=UPI002A809BE9|nr:glycosyltransferase [Bacteroides fluxus]MDY3789807.1 glycosyltransferase [Bacteroides fluxus]
MTIKQKILNILPLSIIKILKNRKSSKGKNSIIYNIGVDCKKQPKVLLCYTTAIFSIKNWKEQLHGTRNLECAALIRALTIKGCHIDLCSCNYTDNLHSDYDYIIGFGKSYRNACKVNPSAKKILYLTEKPPYFSKQKENERIQYFYERHHVKAKISRTGLYFTDNDLEQSDLCIFLGRNGDEQYLPPTLTTYTLAPSGLTNPSYDDTRKNFGKARKHFLWMGSRGAIHKGLDILFDAFSQMPDLTLHIAGLDSYDRKLLSKIQPPNVIDHGYIIIGTQQFDDVMNQCAYFIFPSCSEAVSTSIITAMNFGLIPIVTKETSIVLDGFGKYIESYQIDNIINILSQIKDKEIDELKNESLKVRAYSSKNYSLDSCSENINRIIDKIIL